MYVTDPRAIRALAHPVRLDLLEVLGGIGPATAARCAAVVGQSHASVSYHLRQLAKYGFVQAGEPTGDQRERPWQVTSRSQNYASGAGGAADELSRVRIEREATKILEFIDRRPGEQPAWREAAYLSMATVPMTADELSQLRVRLAALLEPYLARLAGGAADAVPPGGRWVRLLLAGTPYPELDLATLGAAALPPDDLPPNDRNDDGTDTADPV